MTNYTGRRGNHSEKENGCSLKNIGHIHLIYNMHILGAYVDTCLRYEVPVSKHVAQEEWSQATTMMTTTHDDQSRIL